MLRWDLIYNFDFMNIFLTWDSKWIWKVLYENLQSDYNTFWVSRNGQYKFNLLKDIKEIETTFKNTEFDTIILNAWMWDFNSFKYWDLQTYEDIINLNLLANIKLLKKLKYHKMTKIIFIWSIIWKKFMNQASVYQASKFWLRWFAWGLKKEWYKCFIINPKIVDTCFHPEELDLSCYPKTDVKDVVKTVKNIIKGEENRFEIDL